jgi:orotidine-5'-phosphate decarboxylase
MQESDTEHFADRLTQAIRLKRNALCVGLDPRWELLPDELRDKHRDGTLAGVARAYEEFCFRVIDLVAPLVPVVKPQSAFYEACGPAGMEALKRIIARAREKGLIAIMDGKRNDIASTAVAYAEAAFEGVRIDNRMHAVWDADAITVNPYLGTDAVEPFLESARRAARGVFVLVRTSNRGAGQFQDLKADGRPVFLHVADAVRAWTKQNLGRLGFGDVGAVVGATHPDELAVVRRALPEGYFLLPGFGAQGATASDIPAAFRDDGLGAIVSSSRGLTFCYSTDDRDWEEKIEAATRVNISELRSSTPMGKL